MIIMDIYKVIRVGIMLLVMYGALKNDKELRREAMLWYIIFTLNAVLVSVI